MDFLINARLPFLDGYVSEILQSMIVEVSFWMIVYHGFVALALPMFRSFYRKSIVWKTAKKRVGIFCGNGRDDCVLLSIMGVHHMSACLFTLAGMYLGDANIWRHGYFLEIAFEVYDDLAMFLGWYPYTGEENVKSDIVPAIFFHHLPGIILSPFVMQTGLYTNPHLQLIAIWLLGGAAVSTFTGVFIYRFDVDTQMPLIAATFCPNVFFFLYCRAYVFPLESLALIRDVEASETLGDNVVLLRVLYFALGSLTLFNVAIIADVIPKTVRTILRAYDGTTLIDTEPIPPSRDSVLAARGRRSSVAAAFEAARHVSRASFVTVLNMNTVTTVDAPPAQDLDDLPEEDAKALRQALTSMTDKKTT